MKKITIGAIAFLLLAAGCNNSGTTTETNNSNQTQSTPNPAPSADPENLKTFTVKGSNFAYTPTEIKVKKGDTVRIVFENTGGFHDWVLDEFNAKTKQIGNGQSETIEFVADKTGTFEFYCSVGSHRQMGMKGSFIVE